MPMRILAPVPAVALAIALVVKPVMGQQEPTLRLEGHLGFTHPPPCLLVCHDYSGAGPAVDVGVGAEFGLRGSVSLYGSISYYELRTSHFEPADGVGGGAGVRIGSSDGRGPWAGAGFLVHQRTREFSTGPDERTRIWSSFGPGFEISSGWSFRLSRRVVLGPTVRYRRYHTMVDLADAFGGPENEQRYGTDFFVGSVAVGIDVR